MGGIGVKSAKFIGLASPSDRIQPVAVKCVLPREVSCVGAPEITAPLLRWVCITMRGVFGGLRKRRFVPVLLISSDAFHV